MFVMPETKILQSWGVSVVSEEVIKTKLWWLRLSFIGHQNIRESYRQTNKMSHYIYTVRQTPHENINRGQMTLDPLLQRNKAQPIILFNVFKDLLQSFKSFEAPT